MGPAARTVGRSAWGQARCVVRYGTLTRTRAGEDPLTAGVRMPILRAGEPAQISFSPAEQVKTALAPTPGPRRTRGVPPLPGTAAPIGRASGREGVQISV